MNNGGHPEGSSFTLADIKGKPPRKRKSGILGVQRQGKGQENVQNLQKTKKINLNIAIPHRCQGATCHQSVGRGTPRILSKCAKSYTLIP